jgi:hypothetical protein
MIPNISKKTVYITISVISFIIGSLFGTGIIWQKKRIELEEIRQISELRKEIDRNLYNLIDLSGKYVTADNNYKITKQYAYSKEAYQVKIRMDMIKDNFIALEQKLAMLENRKPRPMPDLYPPRYAQPPTELNIR